jgi:hypothetical protein
MRGLSDGGPVIPLLALVIAWLSCAAYVARTTTLRTNVRWLHAILTFPVVVLLVPAGVIVAKVLVPELYDVIERVEALETMSADGRIHLAELSSIALAVPLPAFFFWRYRRLMDRQEQRALDRFRGEGV